MKKMSTIILGGDTKAIRSFKIYAEDIYPPVSIFNMVLRNISFSLKLSTKYWMTDIQNVVRGHSLIIVFDYPNMVEICREVEEKADKGSRLVLYLWNPMLIYSADVIKQISSRWEIWTFDPKDAQTHGFKYAGQFLYDNYLPDYKDAEFDSDLFFIGINKGRFKFLRELEYKCLKDYNIRPHFIYVDKFRGILSKSYSGWVSYKDMLLMAAKSKAILELNQSEQAGLTLRALEALLMKKKLVTNNNQIKHYKFAKHANVYILNNDMDSLAEFLNQPMINVELVDISQYRFKSWLERIEKGVELDDYIEN